MDMKKNSWIGLLMAMWMLMALVMTGCGGAPAPEKFAIRLALVGPICPENPGSIMRLCKGTCYISTAVAAEPKSLPDWSDLPATLEEIRKKEEA